jgi:hypothetical protein
MYILARLIIIFEFIDVVVRGYLHACKWAGQV